MQIRKEGKNMCGNEANKHLRDKWTRLITNHRRYYSFDTDHHEDYYNLYFHLLQGGTKGNQALKSLIENLEAKQRDNKNLDFDGDIKTLKDAYAHCTDSVVYTLLLEGVRSAKRSVNNGGQRPRSTSVSPRRCASPELVPTSLTLSRDMETHPLSQSQDARVSRQSQRGFTPQ